MESVTAAEIFVRMVSGVSVRRMRERGSLSDLDILEVGSRRDITRFAGAV